MSVIESFPQKFHELLREIPADCTLDQWQYLYRQVLVAMGTKIIDKFPSAAVGPPPAGYTPGAKKAVGNAPMGGDPGHNPGGGAGGHPEIVCRFTCFVLGLRGLEPL